MSEELTTVLKDISSQLAKLIRVIDSQTRSPCGFEWTDLLQLPKHLQTTAIALGKIGRARASDIAEATGKARAMESAYLNNLVLLGLARKEQDSHRTVYFMPVLK